MTMSKKALIAGSFLAATAVAGTATAGAPVIYGKANISLHSNDADAANSDNWTLESNASRLGVKGKHKLTDKLSAVYKAEYEVYFDNKDGAKNGSDFALRNIYAGIAGGFGMVRAGRFDTPFKKAQGKIDLFNDLQLGDIKNTQEGVYDADNRGSNMVQYDSPKFAGGLKVHVAFQAGEQTGANSRDGVADGQSVAVTYKTDALFASLAWEEGFDGVDDEGGIRAAVQGKVTDALKLGAMVQLTEDDNNTLEGTGVVLSAAFTAGKNTFKAQYSTEEVENTVSNVKTDTSLMNIGVDHKLNKKTKVFAYYGGLNNDGVAADPSTIAVGMEVKF